MIITTELSEACRNLSKSGTLAFDEEYLRRLSETLTAQEAIELHAFFRDESHRFESEWRNEFLDLFPQATGVLPEVDEAESWQEDLFGLVRAGDLQAVQAFIERVGTADQQFDPQQIYSECTLIGYGESLPDVPFDFYPIEGADEAGITAVGLAQELGHSEIASFLESVIAELDRRYLEAYQVGRGM